MIKSIFILGTLSLMLLMITSCGGNGPESIDVKSAESTCDCIDLKIEILKGEIDVMENIGSTDTPEDVIYNEYGTRYSWNDVPEYDKWFEKDMEHRRHCREIDKRWHKDKSCENYEKYDDLDSKANKLYSELNPPKL